VGGEGLAGGGEDRVGERDRAAAGEGHVPDEGVVEAVEVDEAGDGEGAAAAAVDGEGVVAGERALEGDGGCGGRQCDRAAGGADRDAAVEGDGAGGFEGRGVFDREAVGEPEAAGAADAQSAGGDGDLACEDV